MAFPGLPQIGHELLDVPFPEMIKSMGLGVAEAQFELDRVGMRLAQMMSGEYEVEEPDPQPDDPLKMKTVKKTAYITFDGKQLSMLELGFTPTFYQFVDTLIEVKVSISMTASKSMEHRYSRTSIQAGSVFFGFGAAGSLTVTSVSAAYASKYSYSAEGSSLLRTKLVPVPPPAVLEERIRKIVKRKDEVTPPPA